jgi:hypothetical protein
MLSCRLLICRPEVDLRFGELAKPGFLDDTVAIDEDEGWGASYPKGIEINAGAVINGNIVGPKQACRHRRLVREAGQKVNLALDAIICPSQRSIEAHAALAEFTTLPDRQNQGGTVAREVIIARCRL